MLLQQRQRSQFPPAGPDRPAAFGDDAEAGPFPPEVDMILSAMEVGRSGFATPAVPPASATLPAAGETIGCGGLAYADPAGERRRGARAPYRTRARLKLYADPADAPARTLYTRDVDRRGLGFITPHLLPLGYGGWVTLRTPEGEEVRVECTLYRCRKTVQGWYEGAVKFHREAWQFG